MWQALLAAAVAGSTGIVAKRLFRPCDSGDLGAQSNADPDRREFEPRNDERDAIFRFSSSSTRDSTKKKKKKKTKKKNEARVEVRSGGSKSEKKVFGSRRLGVSLKRRKICRNVPGKRAESGSTSSSSQDTSLFSWGLGVGMMCMMSAGKTEISKLNVAMNETAKVVEELKTELCKRKSSHDLQASSCGSEAILVHNITSFKVSESGAELNESTANKITCNELKSCSPNPMNDGECASSVLTEEPAPGTLEMDQLEAELEIELQKLPWCAMEDSDLEDSEDLVETELLPKGFPEQMRPDSNTNRLSGSGILPEELDQKLCHLLIERQGSHIEELESELTSAQRKLHEKEVELQALKDCVKRLTEISLSTFSDDETEAEMEKEQSSDWSHKKVGSESRYTTGVGMKRATDSKFM